MWATNIILPITSEEVHVWSAQAAPGCQGVASLSQFLSPEENHVEKKFAFAEDRLQFVLARGILRQLLGVYLQQDPRGVVFSYNRYGKPSLGENQSPIDLRFNVSHSYGMILLAFSQGRDVGVDVERVRELTDLDSLAAQCYSPSEQMEHASLISGVKRDAFFAVWTQKEAYLKARGTGLSTPLTKIQIGPVMAAGHGARRRIETLEPSDEGSWSVEPLNIGPGYAAAVAAEGTDWRAVLKGDFHAARTVDFPET